MLTIESDGRGGYLVASRALNLAETATVSACPASDEYRCASPDELVSLIRLLMAERQAA